VDVEVVRDEISVKLYTFHDTFLAHKKRTKRSTGNPRQIRGFGFALKTPTKLKIHLNPTK
jgi:hypothetical protein